MVKCYYTILGLSKGCREDEIKKQYKKLAKQYHPDKNTAQNAEEVFKDIDKSYRVLMDKKNREIYDLYGEEGLKKAARAKAWASTSKLEYPLRVTIEELANGCTKKVRISRNVVESDEKRRVEMKMLHVSIQKGSKPGTRILFRGEGDRLPYKVPGDIIFILKVKPSNAHPPHPHPHCHPPFFSRTPHHQQEKQQNSAPPPPAKPYQPEEFLVDKLLRERSAKLKSASSGPEPEPKRNTTDSPFNSATSFEELPLRAELKKGIYAMGFHAPSKMQETVLPLLLREPTLNVIAQAQSGTGKTAALVIAMLNSVRTDCLYPQVLCLCPTSELALQIGQMVLEIGQFIPGIRVGYAVSLELGMGDATLTEQVLIGTPGKVKDWAFDRRRFDLGKITSFYLDEADSLIATQGYRDQCIKIHRKLNTDCRKIMFSATYTDEVRRFAEKMIPNAKIMKLKREEETLENIKQVYISCKYPEDKYQAIATIYGLITVGKSVIFCQTRVDATFLASRLAGDTHSVALLHGELDESQRLHILNSFREGRAKILILTSAVQIRGMDFEQVTLVFNYDLPTDVNHQVDCDTYLHQIGRTGRFGRMGIAINLVTPEAMVYLSKIRSHFNKRIHKLDIDDIEEVEKLETYACIVE